MTTKARIQSRLKRSKRYVFTRDDFKDLAGYDQIGRALYELVKEGLLLKVGYGDYTKARQNAITGKLMPAAPGGSAAVVIEALDRLKVEEISPERGGELNHRVVMNTKSRLKKWSYLD
ncbi:DUF6088 family protein [Buttiauxella sp. S04-F03]|uniref:DUF6088 family protein n=1 Tax=Buttiauxella sp. W03-F01 TaxID=2904524 RepID=UPI001E64A31F|nr:DUF6088 family protein [Buttiauxella sp. W03-F01]MCE0801160.1 DUF6088 family protein [Buttiauxella sp. W03-F01]